MRGLGDDAAHAAFFNFQTEAVELGNGVAEPFRLVFAAASFGGSLSCFSEASVVQGCFLTMLTELLAIMILLGGSLGPRGKSPLLDRPTEPLQWDGGKQRGEAPPLPHVASPDDATSRQSR